MSSSRRVFLVGGHTTPFLGRGNPAFIHKKHPDFGKKSNPDLRQMLSAAVAGCLSSTYSGTSSKRCTMNINFLGDKGGGAGGVRLAVQTVCETCGGIVGAL